MSIPTLQQQQEQLIREIRQHENKAHAHRCMANAARQQLMQTARHLMLAKKSVLKQEREDYQVFAGAMPWTK